jgi:16S rRNA (adenine1518-N6/adenine1519-N6)-dimethyltransferase
VPPPRKRFGQHFLTDRAALQRIVDALDLTGRETVVEIGPGRGALTEFLVPRARRLVGVEVDRDLVAALRARYAGHPHVEIVEADVLQTDLAALARGPFCLIGNVPYNITTPIIFHSLRRPRPERSVFLVQREVAERLAAAEGTAAYGALSVNVQTVARVELVGSVGAGAFHPKPKVSSAIVRLVPLREPLIAPEAEEPFRVFVIGVFGQRRRQLVRALRTVTGLTAPVVGAAVESAGLDPLARAEDLPPSAIVALFTEMQSATA